MPIKAALQHNQSLVAAAVVCLLCFTGFLACRLTPQQRSVALQTAAHVAESAAEGTPLPWSEIGLLIGTILGAGAIVDNRRKDVVIKQEKKTNVEKAATIAKLVFGDSANTPK